MKRTRAYRRFVLKKARKHLNQITDILNAHYEKTIRQLSEFHWIKNTFNKRKCSTKC
jgi:hypothetical protein